MSIFRHPVLNTALDVAESAEKLRGQPPPKATDKPSDGKPKKSVDFARNVKIYENLPEIKENVEVEVRRKKMEGLKNRKELVVGREMVEDFQRQVVGVRRERFLRDLGDYLRTKQKY